MKPTALKLENLSPSLPFLEEWRGVHTWNCFQSSRGSVIFPGAEIHFKSQGSDQGPVEHSGVNNKGAETQRQTTQGVKHRMTTMSEHFSLISTPHPVILGVEGWIVAPSPKDKLKHDIWERDLIWKQGLCRCNQVKMRSHWSKVTLKPVRPMSL